MHADEMKSIEDEVSVLKATISRMEKKISDIIQEIEIGQKTKIEEVVKLVVFMLDSSK